MLIICEKKFNEEKNFGIELTTIYGISETRAKIISALLGLSKLNKIKECPNYQINLSDNTKNIIEKDKYYTIENRLRYQKIVNLRELKNINNYKNLRHLQGLPVNGQRTHTNAKTQKKKNIKI